IVGDLSSGVIDTSHCPESAARTSFLIWSNVSSNGNIIKSSRDAVLVHIQSYLLYVRMRFDQPDYSQSRAAVASGRCVFGMISSVTGQLWVKEGRESQRRLRFTLHFLPLAGRINPFTALLHEASIPMGHYPNK